MQFDCDNDPSRRWMLNETTGGIYQVKNVQTGKCLTIAGGESTANNVLALQFDCDSHPSRTWRISDVTGSGVHQIRNVQTNKCLTIAGGESDANNLQLLQFNCDSRSVAPLDDQAEAVGRATVLVDHAAAGALADGRRTRIWRLSQVRMPPLG